MVYIAPPNKHLLVTPDGSVSLTQSELVHFVRPSADLLFESVAGSYKNRAIAVVLTGTGSDGSMGVRAIKKMGGKEYQTYLEKHPEEFGLLFNTILINVTSFFRDPEAWGYVSSQIVPRLLAGSRPDSAIRIWSSGCASGEEAYTLAIILAEQLGIEQFRRRVKIYASDVDEDALAQWRHATYTASQIQDLPTELLARYFERIDDRFVFHKDLRRSIIFGRHDLVQDAPISRVNLLVCRNTLMYFTRDTQAKVLNRFHFALRDGGFLFMGRAELLLTHAELFTPVELKWRIFTKTMNQNAQDMSPQPQREEDRAPMPNDDRLQVLSLETDPVARMVIRADGILSFANRRARGLCSRPRTRSCSRPTRNSKRPTRSSNRRTKSWRP
jgi:two-component system, chemotaxis family, CheB/CheR fusion protein